MNKTKINETGNIVVGLAIMLSVVAILTLLAYFYFTDLPFAEMFREDKCLDNGGSWDYSNEECIVKKNDE